MENVPFTVDEWLPENRPVSIPTYTKSFDYSQDTNIEMDIERVTREIERTRTDLTANYDDWVKIGFALAHELGEMGRSYFHRISALYPGYSLAKADKKYDNCVKNQHPGVKINTFFYLAKQAGIQISQEQRQVGGQLAAPPVKESAELMEKEDSTFDTPLLPENIYDHLPPLLDNACSLFIEGIEKDIFLMSALTVLSACLPNIEGIYFNRNLSAHLYLFIVGPSASGKGTMVWSRYFAQAIQDEMYQCNVLAQEDYLKELEAYEALPKTERAGISKPEEPPRKMIFIPANSSSSALIQLMAENNFRGIIFESEADTLSNTAKQDWGDSSDIFRKAFHHENTSMARRSNRELIEITNPHLAICISGTPKQVEHLMPEVDNGLFSRFMYYAFQDTRGFLNPFVSHQPINYNQFFIQKSYEVLHFYERLKNNPYPIDFKLTETQGTYFTQFFQTLLYKNKVLLSRDLDANVKRLGVITFRIAMVITSLRLMEMEIGNPLPDTLTCSDQDFETAITIATTLESHAVAVYQHMPKVTMKGLRLSFYEKLPHKFDRQQYLTVANDLGINHKTAEKYIALYKVQLLNHQYNQYTKIIL